MIIGLGTGRCGTQTFAKMFDLPHEKENRQKWESDVSPIHIVNVEQIMKDINGVKFVCLKRDRDETIKSIVANSKMTQEKAEEYYDRYYRVAEYFEKTYENFKIFDTDELNNPERIEKFLGIKAKKVEPINNVCNFMRSL